MEFVFDPGYVEVACRGDYGFDSQHQFEECVLDYSGCEIVEIVKETIGYYNITFEDGHKLWAISCDCIRKGD